MFWVLQRPESEFAREWFRVAVDVLVTWPRETVDPQCGEIAIDEAARRRLDLPLQAGDGSILDNGVPSLGNCKVPFESGLPLATGLTEKRAELRPFSSNGRSRFAKRAAFCSPMIDACRPEIGTARCQNLDRVRGFCLGSLSLASSE